MKTILKLLFIVFLLSTKLFPYDWLYVQNPQNPWYSGLGTIEDAVVSIKPKGIYMEYGIYLTFSARGLGFSNSDTLEVQFYFDLPANSIVHDSWLWIDDEIIRAEIMDQWTAAGIYEDIVNRRKDPSILFKRGQGNYELRIYPMPGNETRKVKITYLCPTQWNSTNVISSLPTNLLNVSKNPLSSFHILTWPYENWHNPKVVEFPQIEFVSHSDSLFGNYFEAILPSEAIQSNVNFSVDAPFSNGVYVNKFSNNDGGIYQMAFLPSKALDISTSYKAAILIDYDVLKSSYSKEDLINGLKSALLNNLSDKDSFNIIFSKISVFRVSENWISADSSTIENIFQNLDIDQIANYSNMPSLIGNGIDFAKNNGNDGSLLLISNSDQVGEYEIANDLINDLLALMDPALPIHVVDFQNQNYNYYWFGGRYYTGNEYFYSNLTRLTSANYFSLLNGGSLSEILSAAFQSLSGFISSFDLYTDLGNGFCYGRYSLDMNINSVYLNKPILQVGKFMGDFPFIIEVSGVYNSIPISQQFILNEEDIFSSDSLSEEAWAGNYIKYLENQPQTNDIVNEIVDYSITERVLSVYSAFLCLEPEQGGVVCYDCLDETNLVEVNDSLKTDSVSVSLNAYPNPFNNQVNIKITLPSSLISENITFNVHNILGEVVKTFQSGSKQSMENFRFIWDGKNNDGSAVASGIYFFVVTTPEKNYSMKLLLMK